MGHNIANSETSPHSQESQELPAGVNNPVTDQGHENSSNRVGDDKYNCHDDAMSICFSSAGSVSVGRYATVVGTGARVRVRIIAAARIASEGVSASAEARFGEVDVEAIMAIVLVDLLGKARRVQRVTRLPSSDPGVGARKV